MKPPAGTTLALLFGSSARQDGTADSDTDILIASERTDARFTAHALSYVRSEFGESAELSLYQNSRLAEMYSTGHLFAWHLFQEAVRIPGVELECEFAWDAQPCHYAQAVEDVETLREVASQAASSVRSTPLNCLYEAGVLFVCCRNIALSASWYSDEGLNFRPQAPLEVCIGSTMFPLSHACFEELRRARWAGSRRYHGGLPAIKPTQLLDHWEALRPWMASALQKVTNERENDVSPRWLRDSR